MKIFTSTKFEGFQTTDVAALVFAQDHFSALKVLQRELKRVGLEQDIRINQVQEVSPVGEHAIILQAGKQI